MSFYKQKLERVKKEVFDNQEHLDAVIAIRRYINEHLESELDLDSLAEIHSISKYHLIRLFKRYHGITPKQYIISSRLNKAKDMLHNPDLRISDIAYECGFEDPANFSKSFVSMFGLSPSQYKNQLS